MEQEEADIDVHDRALRDAGFEPVGVQEGDPNPVQQQPQPNDGRRDGNQAQTPVHMGWLEKRGIFLNSFETLHDPRNLNFEIGHPRQEIIDPKDVRTLMMYVPHENNHNNHGNIQVFANRVYILLKLSEPEHVLFAFSRLTKSLLYKKLDFGFDHATLLNDQVRAITAVTLTKKSRYNTFVYASAVNRGTGEGYLKGWNLGHFGFFRSNRGLLARGERHAGHITGIPETNFFVYAGQTSGQGSKPFAGVAKVRKSTAQWPAIRQTEFGVPDADQEQIVGVETIDDDGSLILVRHQQHGHPRFFYMPHDVYNAFVEPNATEMELIMHNVERLVQPQYLLSGLVMVYSDFGLAIVEPEVRTMRVRITHLVNLFGLLDLPYVPNMAFATCVAPQRHVITTVVAAMDYRTYTTLVLINIVHGAQGSPEFDRENGKMVHVLKHEEHGEVRSVYATASSKLGRLMDVYLARTNTMQHVKLRKKFMDDQPAKHIPNFQRHPDDPDDDNDKDHDNRPSPPAYQCGSSGVAFNNPDRP